MSEVVFEGLGIPAPGISLGWGSDSQAVRTAVILCHQFDAHREPVMRKARRVTAGQAKNGRRPELGTGELPTASSLILAERLVSA
jgi:hypothetical protein